jgi:hypothetical protein
MIGSKSICMDNFMYGMNRKEIGWVGADCINRLIIGAIESVTSTVTIRLVP